MIYISKGKGRRKGLKFLKRFINSKWDKNLHQYINLSYDELRRENSFLNLLIDEQSGVCCYCMRKISSENATLEHIIPFSISKNVEYQISLYQRIKYLSKKRVVYIKEKELDRQKHLSIPPTPHFIAYENLVASCNGLIYGALGNERKLHQTCNNVRGNDLITPLFFNPEQVQSVKYQIDGTYLCADEKVEETMNLVKINNAMLVLFRKAWAAFVIEGIDVEEIKSNPDNISHRKDMTDYLSGYVTKEERKSLYVKKEYWMTFLGFEWFYGYFKKHIPRWKCNY